MSEQSSVNSPSQARFPMPVTWTMRAVSPVCGVEIGGLDLRQPIDESTRAAIEQAIADHQLLVFRDQDLSDEQQFQFTLRFGEIENHVVRRPDGSRTPLVHHVTNLDQAGRPTRTPASHGNYHWHTDKSYHEIPSYATLLHARQLPPSGGDTQFANLYLGYEALPQSRRRELEGLRVVHSWEASRINTGNRPATEDEKRERPPVEHPLVRTHPVSGRKLLYIGMHTSHVIGMPTDAGRALLDELLAFCTRPEFVYTHHWQPGDLVMWDNRCLLHRALDNYDMGSFPRVLHRTVLKGSRPY
ncbi:MAG: TauD/TfdA family dioxygenase [Gammaproteobacteria bacterium]|nr:TauD/TfdA family dioxygenase [Gammaproteobacteria bacterium]